LIAEFPASAGQNVRFNDGKCDPMGRFWVGTMHKEQIKGAADLYMLQDDTMVIKQPDVTISNGIVWDTNKNLMYYIDTPTQSVYAYDYDNETGEITNRRVGRYAVDCPLGRQWCLSLEPGQWRAA
ncbi:SMP-30/gluconolactonase/LRE family protein, partial [Marinilabilia sp.]